MSLTDQDYGFLATIAEYVRKRPEIAPYITDFIRQGIEQALDESRNRAADMEIALIAALSKRNKKWADELLKDKITKWKDRGSINPPAWDEIIKDLSK